MAETLDPAPAFSTVSSPLSSIAKRAAVAPRICSLFAVFVAVLVLAGWSTHVYALVTIFPALPAMAQSTAGAFLLAGVALWLQRKEAQGSTSRSAARILAAAVFIIGLVTLLKYSLLLASQGTLPAAAGHPINRMSPNSAVNFVLLGAALFLADVHGRHDQWLAQPLALIVILDALVALVGQLYGVTYLYGMSPFLGMAVHTAAVFILLSVGLLLARPDRGFVAIVLADDAAGRVARRLLPLALIAPIMLGGVGLLSQRLHHPNTPFLAYLLVVVSIALLGWLVWGSVLTLSLQVRRAQLYERQVADLERGRVEDALQASEQRLLFAVEGAGIGTWHWDIPADTLVWSPHCKQLFGLPTETQMTRSLFFERIHPHDRGRAEKTIARSLEEGTAYEIEYRVVWTDGAIHWVAAKGRGYRDSQGQPVRFEGIIQDIDVRKEAETTLREASERQKTLLRDVLSSVTGGRLRLVEKAEELPAPLVEADEQVALTVTDGLRTLRQQVRDMARRLGFGDERWQDLMTAASEGGMNAVTHGGGHGRATVSSDGHGTMQVRVQDWGTGINMENLPRAALSRGWSSTASLGHGLVMMLQSVDRLWLLTGPNGTIVVIEQDRTEPPPAWL